MTNKPEYVNALPTGTKLDGTEVEQYEILSVLGEGGFGITYKAYDHSLKSDVAIKEYFPDNLSVRSRDGITVVAKNESVLADYNEGLTRFREEARTLAKFKSDPNIVRVECYFATNGTAYMVMEFVEGEPLASYLNRKGILDEKQLKALMFPVLDGLRDSRTRSLSSRLKTRKYLPER